MVNNIRKVSMWLGRQTSDIAQVNAMLVAAFVFSNNLRLRESSWLARIVADINNATIHSLLENAQRYHVSFDIEALINLFEFVISPSDRIVNGSIYTPKYIREAIIAKCFDTIEITADKKIADISCGCGGFLVDAAQELHRRTGKSYKAIFKENLFGIDIQDYSIERTKILLSLIALLDGEDDDFEFNLWTANTLDFDFQEIGDGFDIIVGNPPYVCSKNIASDTRKLMKAMEVCKTGHPDLYIPFMKIAADNLRKGGMMGFITVNSFLKSLNGRALRLYYHEQHKAIDILDFRGKQIFTGRNTYTCLFFLQSTYSDSILYANNEEESFNPNKHRTRIDYSDLDAKAGWNLNRLELTQSRESAEMNIGKYCSSRHGIATLSNKTYIFKPVAEDARYYMLYKDGVQYQIERGICKDIINSNKLNSEVKFDNLIEKVIFPYRRNEVGAMHLIPEDDLRQQFPKAYAYLQSQRNELAKRDKGNTKNYPAWYAFGRTQSLVMPRYKLFFPKIANRSPRCVLIDNRDLLLYNGMAFVNDDVNILRRVQSIIESADFWDYVTLNGKPYSSGYYALNGNNIKNYGVNL